MKLLFVANKINNLLEGVDTTVFLIQRAWQEKHEVWFSTIQDLNIAASKKLVFWCSSTEIAPGRSYMWYEKKRELKVDLLSFSAIIIRVDPPFDQQYLISTNILDFVSERGICIVNSPRSLRNFNEKLFALKFPDHVPASIVSSNKKEIIDFLRSKKQLVLKPLNLMGGQGIFLVKTGDKNLDIIIDTMTRNGRDKIISQEFLSNIKDGDKRIIIINGIVEKYALCRKPKKGSIIANLAGGGSASVVKLNEEEFEIANEIASTIKRDIFFAGLDMIDKKITEINITSPTGMRQISEYKSPKLAAFFFEQLRQLIG